MLSTGKRRRLLSAAHVLVMALAAMVLPQCNESPSQSGPRSDSQTQAEMDKPRAVAVTDVDASTMAEQAGQETSEQDEASEDSAGDTSNQDEADTSGQDQDEQPVAAEPGETLYIVPIGDSITHGGRRDDEYSWRYPLFKMLTDAGVDFDFVGAYKRGLKGDFKWPDYKGEPFDVDHQAKYGIKTGKMRDRMKEDRKKWSHAPDIALIHLGTNDQKSDDHRKTVYEPLKDIIKMLREENPEVIVLLGHLNFSGGVAKNKIRPLVEELAKEMNTKKSPVVTVRHYKGFNANPQHPDTDTYDWAHPNPKGQKKMAAKWLEAMKPFVPTLRDSE